jgi:ElaB/YqjD/DUF883 family membrane-anchored ribosome-binding protein
MAANSENLPEGTDTIIPGASAGASDDGLGTAPPPNTKFEPAATAGNGSETKAGPPPGTSFEPAGGSIRERIGETTADLRGQAADKAREFASQGKEKAVGALDNVVKLVDDAAGTIDEKVGEQYGAYARRAAESLSSLAASIREKDVDELVRDARDAVRKSPAIAIGAAAAVGFLIARVIKSASKPAGGGGESASKSPTPPDVPDRPAV